MTPETSNPTLTTVGSYELVEKIAEGGMGSIYKGRHRETGQIVAIKVMPRHLANNSVLRLQINTECHRVWADKPAVILPWVA